MELAQLRVSGNWAQASVNLGVRFDMEKPSTRILVLTVLVIVAAMAFPSSRAVADAVWINGRPVFRSDIVRQKRLMERRREMRRRQYQTVFPVYMTGGPRPDIEPSAPPLTSLRKPEKAGTVIIDTYGRRLFFVLPNKRAFVYPISVGRLGFTWTGTKKISRIASWPDWHPPPEMRLREPGLPKKMTGGIRNPLGAKALYLDNSLYRIHGTNDRKSIGRAASSGCFRMMNHHVMHLSTMVDIGTEVRVVARYRGAS